MLSSVEPIVLPDIHVTKDNLDRIHKAAESKDVELDYYDPPSNEKHMLLHKRVGDLVHRKPILSSTDNGPLSSDDINSVIIYYKRLQRMRIRYLYAHREPDSESIPKFCLKLLSHPYSSIVFNTGSHWVALRRSRESLEYFDSLGRPPTKMILRLIRSTDLAFTYSKTTYQRGGFECGIYVIAFLLQHKIADDLYMNSLRSLYFRTKLHGQCDNTHD